MKLILLAAGKGTRMASLTKDAPKCLLNYRGKALINYTIDVAKANKITDFVIVTGYKADKLKETVGDQDVRFIYNDRYNETNMVHSLFCAQHEFTSDIIVSYSDIIYEKSILKQLLPNSNEISVIVDKAWKDLWSLRMENPLDDAESMKITTDGFIEELGKKTHDINEIQGQYIGLIKFPKIHLANIVSFYQSLDRSKRYDGQRFEQMYMTTFLQLLINNGMLIKAEKINGGWLEFDSAQDLAAYEKLSSNTIGL